VLEFLQAEHQNTRWSPPYHHNNLAHPKVHQPDINLPCALTNPFCYTESPTDHLRVLHAWPKLQHCSLPSRICWWSWNTDFICQHVEYMQEITMLIPYLLTKFQDFSVYLISRTWSTIWDFSRNLKGKLINVRVTKGVHVPGRPHRTKPRSGGHKRWSISPTWAPNQQGPGAYTC
jgi:hypothetical protein